MEKGLRTLEMELGWGLRGEKGVGVRSKGGGEEDKAPREGREGKM